ncbi:MAG: HAMP domain-containing histidine kinase, partial [Bacteroidales bacterium]|nr:HAMP domain-containing histidine kinase [Bacteroidales bacterium]
VDNTLKVAESNALVKGIKIQNKIDNNIKVHTDENMIATVFRNLISNAVKSTQSGGNINITAKEEKNFCIFCVADNGSGIDKPEILDLFNKGSQKKINENTCAFKGFGLIICKEFVEKNGGEIWLETQKGEGSKFYFTVPC